MQIHDTKTCTKCGETKPLSGFHKDKSRPSGLFPQCKTCVCARVKAWYAENTERALAAMAMYRAEHPDRKRWQPTAEWAHAHYERYKERHPGRHNENGRRWKANNRTHANEDEARRRARKRNAPVVEKIDRTAIIARDRSICHICGKHVAPKDMSLDHLVPLARGGEHTAQNLAVAHLRCNMRRGPGWIPAQLRLT